MKREIKFRGLRIDINEWIYGMFITIRNVFDDEDTEEKTMFIDSQWIAGCEAIGECWVEVNPETVGQFTGQLDCNGIGIYEGDIVKTGTDKVMCISWSEKHASFVIDREGWAFLHYFGEAFDGKDCEVIGNKYQNPELLLPACDAQKC